MITFDELEIQINNLIAKDEVEAAIALLSRYFHGDEKLKAIVLQSGRFHSLRKDHMNGVIDYNSVQQYMSQLRVNILDFVQARRGELLPEEQASESEPDIRELYRASLARVSVALALRQEPEGLPITKIQQAAQVKNRKYVVRALQEMEANGLADKNKVGKAAYWKLTDQGSKEAEVFWRVLRLVSDEA